MAEGTNVGNIYLDLIVRDTVEKQVQDMAAKGQRTAQKAFAGMEKTAEASVNKVATQAGKVAQKVAAPLGDAFNKPVAMARAKLKQLEDEFSALSLRAENVMRKDTSFQLYGYVSDGNKEFRVLEKQLDGMYRRMEAARERLAIETQAAAQKQAAAEEKAARRAVAAAEKAAAAAAISAAKREREEKKAAIAAEKAAQKAAAAEEKAANRRKGILAAMWKNMLANAGVSSGKVSGKIRGIAKSFNTAGKSAKRFGTRLREILRGALIFNGISRALRGMTQYFQEVLSVSDEMQQALANLKGAAANAASPLIQVLTPALVKIANAAAVALTYVERLLTRITGKASNAAEVAAKIAEKNAKKTQRYLAGFDQLNRMDSKDEEDKGIEPNYGFKGFNSFLESILTAIKAGQWAQVGELLAEKLNSTLETIPWDAVLWKARNWTQNLVDALNGFIHRVDFSLIGTTLGQGLNTLLTVIDTFFQGTNWKALGTGFAAGLKNLIISVDWPMLGRALTDKLKALFELLHGFITTFDFKTLGTSLAQMLNAAFDNIDWEQLWQDIKLGLSKLFEGICAFFAELEPDILGAVIGALLVKATKSAFEILWPEIGKALGALLPKITGWITGTLVPKVLAALSKIGAVVGMSAGWVAVLAAAVAAVVALVVINGDKIKKALNKFSDWLSRVFCRDWTEVFGVQLGSVFNTFVVTIGGLLRGLKDMFFGLIDVLTGVFTFNWKQFWGGLGSIVKGAVNGVIGVVNGMISAVTGAINILFKLLSFKISIPGVGKIGLSLPKVTAPQIPYLADGGVIKQPTLAMVGEYAGASSNPEIVAPQSLIADTVASVVEDMMLNNQTSLMEVASILRQILNAVVSISSGRIQIIIDGREVFQVVIDENNRAILRNGKSPLRV